MCITLCLWISLFVPCGTNPCRYWKCNSLQKDCSEWSTSTLSIHIFNTYMKSSSTKPKVSSSLLGGISHLGGALLKELSQSNSNGVNTTMLYVKVVTPLVLKRWVWPTIKCSHLTPKSIYSYIYDLVIANCLIDTRVFVHASPHISFAILLCEHVGCIIYSFEDIHLLFWLIGFLFFCQVDGQECLRTFSSYLWFSHLKLYSCYITKFDQVRFEPLCVRSTRSPPIRHRLKLPKLLCASWPDQLIHFGNTESTKSI